MVNIDDEVMQYINYLAYTFSQSMKSCLHTKEDLVNDLVVFYLERYDESLEYKRTKGFWFISMKNFLLDKYKLLSGRRRIDSTYLKADIEDIEYHDE